MGCGLAEGNDITAPIRTTMVHSIHKYVTMYLATVCMCTMNMDGEKRCNVAFRVARWKATGFFLRSRSFDINSRVVVPTASPTSLGIIEALLCTLKFLVYTIVKASFSNFFGSMPFGNRRRKISARNLYWASKGINLVGDAFTTNVF